MMASMELGGDHLQGGFAIHRELRGVALGAQVEEQTLRQVSLIFDHQDVGGSLDGSFAGTGERTGKLQPDGGASAFSF